MCAYCCLHLSLRPLLLDFGCWNVLVFNSDFAFGTHGDFGRRPRRTCIQLWVCMCYLLGVGRRRQQPQRQRPQRACIQLWGMCVHYCVGRTLTTDDKSTNTLGHDGNPPHVWLFSQEGCRNTIGLLGKWGFTWERERSL